MYKNIIVNIAFFPAFLDIKHKIKFSNDTKNWFLLKYISVTEDWNANKSLKSLFDPCILKWYNYFIAKLNSKNAKCEKSCHRLHWKIISTAKIATDWLTPFSRCQYSGMTDNVWDIEEQKKRRLLMIAMIVLKPTRAAPFRSTLLTVRPYQEEKPELSQKQKQK